jgi:HAD superfamily hydrolase (TIGR01509 family)
VTNIRACLVDVYETLLAYDFQAHSGALAAAAGVALADWQRGQVAALPEHDRGLLSLDGAIARILESCGVPPVPELVTSLAAVDQDLMAATCRPYDDAVPFLRQLRSRGVAIALVSNCGDTTRARLSALDLAPLADALVLSCEIGDAKPSPEIYLRALEELGALPSEAVMIDDQMSYCAGAEAVGIRAIQIARDGHYPTSGRTVVSSLADVSPLL